MFVDRSSTVNYALRDTSNKLAYLKNSFSCSGVVLWNTLPIELRQASTLYKFKSDCSNFFLIVLNILSDFYYNSTALMKNR